MAEYVMYNKKTESLEFAFPEEHMGRSHEIINEIKNEFAYEPLTQDIISKMNALIDKKLKGNSV
ncbi:MAG: hypothetical protein FWG49_00135 [Leptospirales bacterium]|nr:hypothetical protein [Leptospirales bacterium]